MHPDHCHCSVLPGPFLYPCALPPLKIKQVQFVFPVFSLEHIVENYGSASLSQFLQFLQWLYVQAVNSLEGEGVMEAFYVPPSQLWIRSNRYHCKINFFALNYQQEHGSGTSTWFLATAQTMEFHMISGVSLCHRPQHGLWWQYRPQTSTLPLPQQEPQTQHSPWWGRSIGQRHQHGLQGNTGHGYQYSAQWWPWSQH